MDVYIHNKYTQYTHTLCKQKLLFWMQLIAINRLTALIEINLIFIMDFLRFGESRSGVKLAGVSKTILI